LGTRPRVIRAAPFILTFFSVFLFALPCRIGPAGSGGGTKEAVAAEPAGETGGKRARYGEKPVDPAVRRLKDKAQIMIDAHEREICREKGLVRYHEQCMTIENRNKLFEMEIRHVEDLLGEAIKLYATTSLKDVDTVFHQAEEFAAKFETDEIMDERIEEKLLLILGFLYVPTDRIDREMKREMENPKATEQPIAFFERYTRMQAFVEQLHIPLMSLLGERMDAYVVRHGGEKFEKLMADNSLGSILDHLEWKRAEKDRAGP